MNARYLLFVTAISMLLLASSAEASPVPTVGIYDENSVQSNAVDFEATGSSFSLSEFTAAMSDAFLADRGGVNHGYVASQLELHFGTHQTKTLLLDQIEGSNIGSGVPNGSPIPISGSAAMASTPSGGFEFTAFGFTDILNADPDEHIVAFGVTTLSVTNRDYGNVTVTGRLASGASLSATRHMFEPAGAGDTFFGLQAPASDYFTSFTMTYDGGAGIDNRLWFDDIGFITAVVPEPASASFLILGVVGLMRRRRAS